MTRGETDDFDDFFYANYPRIRRVAARILPLPADAEDAAAEAMARAFASWRRVGQMPHREYWVLRVTMNVAVDTLRRQQRAIALPPAAEPSPDDLTALSVREGMRALPRRQREVIGLRYFADLNEAEIADTLGISNGAVKRHAHRALARLREDLAQFAVLP